MDDFKLKNFLNRIAQLESSNGTNLNHDTINNGIQAGQRAIGKYGMLNNTIQETLNRQANNDEISPELDDLRGKDQDTIRQQFSQHPEYEQQVASYLANRVLDNQNGDEEKAAYAWNHGHNLSPDRITDDKLDNSDYVNKYNGIKQQDEANQAEDFKQRASQRALELLANTGTGTLSNPGDLPTVDKAIQNMQGIRNKVKPKV